MMDAFIIEQEISSNLFKKCVGDNTQLLLGLGTKNSKICIKSRGMSISSTLLVAPLCLSFIFSVIFLLFLLFLPLSLSFSNIFGYIFCSHGVRFAPFLHNHKHNDSLHILHILMALKALVCLCEAWSLCGMGFSYASSNRLIFR